MNKLMIAVFALVAVSVCGCRQSKPESGPVKGTVNLDNLTTEEKIKKVQDDPTIPAQYKETFINSIKAKAGKK